MSDWWDRAACKGQDTELFFSNLTRDKRKAKQFCRGCPVAQDCLSDALLREDPIGRYGIFGGLDGDQRRSNYQGFGELRLVS